MSKRSGSGRKARRREPKPQPLTDQQEAFCQELFCGKPSAAQAAVRAGYSRAGARQRAYELLQDPRIQARLAALAQLHEGEEPVTKDRFANYIGAITFSDMRDVATWGPDGVELHASAELAPQAAASIRRVRQRTHERILQRIQQKGPAEFEEEAAAPAEEQVVYRRTEIDVELEPKARMAELYAKLREFVKNTSPFGPDGGAGGEVIPATIYLPDVRH